VDLRLAVVGVVEVEAASGVPLRALVAVGRDAAGVAQHPGRCSRFHVMNVVLRLVNSLDGPPEPGSR
jgi:hypothetical protein